MSVIKLRRNEPAFGVMLRAVRMPAVVLMARHAGFDFVMVDMEHGTYSLGEAENLFSAAAGAGLDAYVRVPELSRGCVSRALDSGARGVMAPMLETAEQARALVGWAKYPPLGGRGLATSGAHTGWHRGLAAADIMAEANRSTLSIAQIETARAVANIEEIAQVEGLDALLIGPNDLAVSLGCPGNLDTPEEAEAIASVAEAAQRNGKIFGMHASAAMLSRWAGKGLRLVMHSLDSEILAQGLKAAAEAAKGAVGSE